MNRSRLALLCLLVPAVVLAQDFTVPSVNYPKIIVSARRLEEFVPKGWVLERKLLGDLNTDRQADAVLLLRQNDFRNVLDNKDGFGVQRLNTNPRMLAVVFANPKRGGFELVAQNHRLIPRHDSPTIDDPFSDIAMLKGKFRVEIGYWASIGSWTTWTTSFLFRHQNGCVRLIGYDRKESARNTGDTNDVSINLLTGAIKKTKGNFSSSSQGVVTWSRLSRNPIICLEAMGDGYEFDPQR